MEYSQTAITAEGDTATIDSLNPYSNGILTN